MLYHPGWFIWLNTGIYASNPPLPLARVHVLFPEPSRHATMYAETLRWVDLLGKLDVVGVEPESDDEWRKAMQSCQAVVCALGASESEPFNVKGPSQV